jgi:shikimate dehydrogenase
MDIRLALVGEDIGYSKSPAIFEAVFRLDGVNGQFEVRSVTGDELPGAVREMAEQGFRGFNVTIPHKRHIIDCLDAMDEPARVIGAVNGVSIESGRLYGYNTDWSGLTHALEPDADLVAGSAGQILIAGTGGSARAVIYTLYRAFAQREFLIVSRDPGRVGYLNKYFREHAHYIDCKYIDSGVRWANLKLMAVFNCTPLGGPNLADSSPFPKGMLEARPPLYFDLNYNRDNALVKQAAELGIRTRDGSAMLVWQALDAYKIWTGREVPFQPVYDAAFGESNGR